MVFYFYRDIHVMGLYKLQSRRFSGFYIQRIKNIHHHTLLELCGHNLHMPTKLSTKKDSF